jgi:hypothetical protein
VDSISLHALLHISRKILKYIILFDFYGKEGGIESHTGLKFGKNTARNFVYLWASLQRLTCSHIKYGFCFMSSSQKSSHERHSNKKI